MIDEKTMNQSKYPNIVQAMLDPAFYPEQPGQVELVQTQMSFVFLTDSYAYKLKKPVNLGYLDYSSLEKRRYFSECELQLNRRLCSEAYLAVLTVQKDDGQISFGDHGEIIDYVLKMKRLPLDKMLNILLHRNQVTDEMMVRLAEKLASFHSKAEYNPTISSFGEFSSITTNTEENFNQTENSVGRTISRNKYERIRDYTRKFLKDNHGAFEKRILENRIRDCHGDLHAAHICFTDSLCIYDCIEFNERFRYGDVASEIAFLAMDLDNYGRADISRSLVNNYVKYSGDHNLMSLLSFYKIYRAYVRGKVESFKLDDPYISEAEKETARRVACGYFTLAGFYVRSSPTLFVMVGVTGSGKSFLAGELSRHTGSIILSSDVIRKQLSGIPLDQHRFEDFDKGIYSSETTRLTYEELIRRGKLELSSGSSIILDATFIRRSDREKARLLAEECEAQLLFIECHADTDHILSRLDERVKAGSVSDGRREVLGPQQNAFESLEEIPDGNRIVIDTSNTIESNILLVLKKLGED
jgi:uncharacterized protein